MRLNLNQLRCFYLTAKHTSVSKAAELLFVTPSAVTMQVKKLEKWLGFRLLVRKGNALVMTKDAESIYTQAAKIFQEAEILELQLEEAMRAQKGEIVIGAHYIPAKYILPKLMALIARLNPELTVKMVMGTLPELFAQLQANDLHFVVSADVPDLPKIQTIPLFTEDIPLVALTGTKLTEKKSIHASEIPSLPLLMQERGTPFVNAYLERVGVTPTVAMENLSGDVCKRLIQQDMGGAFLLRFVVQDELENGVFQEIHVTEGLPHAHFELAYFEENCLTTEAQALVKVLREISFVREDLV